MPQLHAYARRRPALRALSLLACCLAVIAGLVSPAAGADPVPAESRSAHEAMQTADTAGALAASPIAVPAHPTSSIAWRVHGWVLSKTGNPSEALAAYHRAVRLDPADVVARNNLGSLLLASGDVDEALRQIDEALRTDANYADALNNRGVALERKGRSSEATRAYTTATEVAPDHPAAHNNLGAMRLRAGDRRGAAESFRKAAALDEQFQAPVLNLALLDDPSLSDEASYQRLLRMAEAPGASIEIRARALGARAARATMRKDWSEGRRLYLAAVELQPANARLLNNLGAAEDQLGMDRFAALHLGEALRLEPDLHVARNNLGIVHVHRGDPKRAEALFREIIKADARFHRAYYNLGVLQASQGRLADARDSLHTAWRLAPTDAAVRYNLGLIARERGASPARERRAYEEALQLDGELGEAHLALGSLLADPATPADLRDELQARVHLERFLELALASDDEGRAQARSWLRWLDSRAK